MVKKKLLLANNPLLSGPALDEREKSGSPYRELKISSIDRDPNQPRKSFDEERISELASSIKLYGVLNPIIVHPGKIPGKYILVAGERRLRASMLAGLTSIPAIIDYEFNHDHDRTLLVQLVENMQRADLTPLERAQAIGALKDRYNLSIRDIAERLGISKSNVQRSLEILELPADLMNALKEGASESKILLLAKIDDPEIRAGYLKDLESLSRSDLQKGLETKRHEVKEEAKLSPDDLRISDEIQRAIGLKVKLSRNSSNPEHGRVAVEFYSNEDLQEIFRRLVSE